jgi:bacterioferritin
MQPGTVTGSMRAVRLTGRPKKIGLFRKRVVHGEDRPGARRPSRASAPSSPPSLQLGYANEITPTKGTPMQGKTEIIDALNGALTIELTAINQYFVQSKMCKNWGFLKLAHKHYEESIGEMKHADKLIDRILFLEGVPEIGRYDVIRVGGDVKEQFENDLQLETKGVNAYNEGIALAEKLKDGGTRDLMTEILKESEEHVDWLEAQLHLIQTVGIQNYLAEHMLDDDEGE